MDELQNDDIADLTEFLDKRTKWADIDSVVVSIGLLRRLYASATGWGVTEDVSRHCPNCEAYQMRVEQLVRILNSRGNHCCCQFDAQGDTIIEWCAVHAKLRDRVAELEREIDSLNADRAGGCACRFDATTYEQTHWCSTHAKIDEEAPEP